MQKLLLSDLFYVVSAGKYTKLHNLILYILETLIYFYSASHVVWSLLSF